MPATVASRAVWLIPTLVWLTSAITIDNQDPGIQYSSGWTRIRNNDTAVNGLVMLSRGARATATYNFTGIGIAVFGIPGPVGAVPTVSTYSVDDAVPSTYSVDPETAQQQHAVKFWDSGSTLSNGSHILRITNLNQESWYFLSYLEVTPDGLSTSLPGATATSNASSPITSSGSSIGTGALVGSIFAGVAVIGLLFIGVLLWRRKRRPFVRERKVLFVEDGFHPNKKPAEATLARGHPIPYHVQSFATSGSPMNREKGHAGTPSLSELTQGRDGSTDAGSVHARPVSSGGPGFTSSDASEANARVPSAQPKSRGASDSRMPAKSHARAGVGTPTPGLEYSAPVAINGALLPLSSSQESSATNRVRHSADGGVRLAGGPPEEPHEDSDSETLPPEYRPYLP